MLWLHDAECPRSRNQARLFTRGPSDREHVPANVDDDTRAGREPDLRGRQLDVVTNCRHETLLDSFVRDRTRRPRIERQLRDDVVDPVAEHTHR